MALDMNVWEHAAEAALPPDLTAQLSEKNYFPQNASEDLRLTTSHETNGKADLRTRSGIASEVLFLFKPLSLCCSCNSIKEYKLKISQTSIRMSVISRLSGLAVQEPRVRG